MHKDKGGQVMENEIVLKINRDEIYKTRKILLQKKNKNKQG
jgi:hypothetical protein